MGRLGVTFVAAAVAFGAVVLIPAGAAGAAESDNDSSTGSDVSVTRYGGADRYETSLQIAEAFAADAGGSLEWVVLVSGERWTDAVVAAPVAGSLGAPVLMTPPGGLRADAAKFLGRAGVSQALVVGPDTAGASSGAGGSHGPGRGVDAGVLEALGEAGISAERVAGDDRFGTAVAAAQRVTPGVMGDLGRTAIIASADVFADALVAGPFAARGIHPVLLSPPGELQADVSGYLGDADIEHVTLMGGTAALSEAVEQSVKDLGIEVTRLAGATRYDTAVKAAELVAGRYSDTSSSTAGQTCFANSTIGLARARVPFDSFGAAPLLSRLCAPLVLADPDQIPDDTAAYLDAAREAHDAVGLRVFGGDAAVSQTAIDAYLTGEEPESGDDNEADDDQAQDDETDDEQTEDGDGSEARTAPGVLPAGTCGGASDEPPRRLIDGGALEPSWSPDCSLIVYSDGHSLWAANNDGSLPRLLVSRDGGNLHGPVFSPDGALIVYSRAVHQGAHWERHIWVVNADGTSKRQLTHGDVWDTEPSWSPDGAKIVFSRQAHSGRDPDGERIDADGWIAVMGVDGADLTALTPEGPWDHGPAWSPDGTHIAYIASGSPSQVRLVAPDGGDETPLVGNVLWSGGLSWSPSGTHIAFTRGDRMQSSIMAAEVEGFGEAVIADLGGRSFDPKWSPDGERIAFSHYPDDNTRRVYAAGASGTSIITGAQQCRPAGGAHTTAGFPLPGWAAPARGTVRVAVLFVDFPDAQAAHSTEEEAALGLPWAEEYLERNSYRKLDVEFVPHHTWIRAPKSYRDYLEVNVFGSDVVGGNIYQDAVADVDDEIDFSGFHSVAVILPSSHFHGGLAGGLIQVDGVSLPRHINNNKPKDEPDEPGDIDDWGATAAHELAHNMGLLDMYPYDASRHELPELPEGSVWAHVDMGLMGLGARFETQDDDPRFRYVWRWPDGRTADDHWAHASLREMLAWSRWQLDWLNRRQVDCITDGDATVTLAPVARTGGAVAMAAVPLNRRDIIVVESRRKIGYDRGRHHTSRSGGARAIFPGLVTEGVLVYTVDALVDTGQLPVLVAGDSGNGQVEDFPVLTLGESVTVRGYTITVTADDGDTHTVSITRND